MICALTQVHAETSDRDTIHHDKTLYHQHDFEADILRSKKLLNVALTQEILKRIMNNVNNK